MAITRPTTYHFHFTRVTYLAVVHAPATFYACLQFTRLTSYKNQSITSRPHYTHYWRFLAIHGTVNGGPRQATSRPLSFSLEPMFRISSAVFSLLDILCLLAAKACLAVDPVWNVHRHERGANHAHCIYYLFFRFRFAFECGRLSFDLLASYCCTVDCCLFYVSGACFFRSSGVCT